MVSSHSRAAAPPGRPPGHSFRNARSTGFPALDDPADLRTRFARRKGPGEEASTGRPRGDSKPQRSDLPGAGATTRVGQRGQGPEWTEWAGPADRRAGPRTRAPRVRAAAEVDLLLTQQVPEGVPAGEGPPRRRVGVERPRSAGHRAHCGVAPEQLPAGGRRTGRALVRRSLTHGPLIFDTHGRTCGSSTAMDGCATALP
ncbi:MAG: hypothetical protein KatS3mg132_910 [Limisphaera sp.]|nr:MAG: hypothetical protein KatS3mg132_910 [Limisphaera sp.]